MTSNRVTLSLPFEVIAKTNSFAEFALPFRYSTQSKRHKLWTRSEMDATLMTYPRCAPYRFVPRRTSGRVDVALTQSLAAETKNIMQD
jgi:hypothetical protein